MIKYRLICAKKHEFDGWFSSSSDYDIQESSGLITCPHCNSAHISKALMAPNVSTSRQKQKRKDSQALALTMMNKAAAKIRAEIEKTCDYVGEDFAEQARSIHYGETKPRPIYGEAKPREVEELTDEGIDIAPLPDILVPKPKKSQH